MEDFTFLHRRFFYWYEGRNKEGGDGSQAKSYIGSLADASCSTFPLFCLQNSRISSNWPRIMLFTFAVQVYVVARDGIIRMDTFQSTVVNEAVCTKLPTLCMHLVMY